MRWSPLLAALAAVSVVLAGSASAAKAPPPQVVNEIGPLAIGWKTDFSKHIVPLSEFASGGPGKDGIPAIDHPRPVPIAQMQGILRPKEPVISLVVHGRARAYPLQILIWHEIVNDRLGGVPVTVTFCPLCNTAIAFDRRAAGRLLDFGTTGNLRNNDLVMYDRQTESWWQQFGGKAVVGTLVGTQLKEIPAQIVSWGDYQHAHPKGDVLSRATGFSRPYGANPYQGYDSVDSPPYFPAAHLGDHRLPPKERVVFVERGKDAVAIPFSALQKKRKITIEVGGHTLVATWKPGVSSSLDTADLAAGRDVGGAEVREHGKLVVFDEPFWFSVAAFRPHTTIVR